MSIPVSDTQVPGGPFGVINASDQVGGWASVANEAAIGAIPSAQLVVNGTWRKSLSSGTVYLYTSTTPAGGFANGTWTPVIFSGAAGSFSPGVVTVIDTNVALSGEVTFHGVTTNNSDVLVDGQTSAAQNGIYTTGTGAWTRRSDANTAGTFVVGKTVFVTQGDLIGSLYGVTQAPTTLGTDPIQFSVNAAGGSVTDWAHPGTIGSATPNSGVFSTFQTNATIVFGSAVSKFFVKNTATFNADGNLDLTSQPTVYNSPLIVFTTATGVTLSATRTVTLPKGGPWFVLNETTQTLNYIGSTGTGVSVASGALALITSDGTNLYTTSSAPPPTGTGFVHITSGVQDGAARAVNIASADISGILPVANGGTGLSTTGSIGNTLYVSSSGVVAYGALNLSGGANYITGTLPAGNQASQSLAGQLSGTTGSATVVNATMPNNTIPQLGSGGDMLSPDGTSTTLKERMGNWTALTSDSATTVPVSGLATIATSNVSSLACLIFITKDSDTSAAGHGFWSRSAIMRNVSGTLYNPSGTQTDFDNSPTGNLGANVSSAAAKIDMTSNPPVIKVTRPAGVPCHACVLIVDQGAGWSGV